MQVPSVNTSYASTSEDPPSNTSSSRTHVPSTHSAHKSIPSHSEKHPNQPHLMIAYHDETSPPPLNYTLHTKSRERYIIVFFGLLFLEAGILPLILFYSLMWGAHLSITKNLAIITSLIGTVSGFKVAQRTYFLWLKNDHETRRPIGAGRWGLDFTHILINIGLAAFFVPLIIGSSLTPASPPTVAMALPCFMLAFCIPMFISGLFPSHFRLPFRVSSFPPRHPLPPLTYTLVEDVIAVDGGGGLEFRQAWRYRYEASLVMRTLLRDLALFWGISGVLIAIALIIVAWMTSHDIGYGLGYGMPWLWAFASTGITIVWVRKELERERKEWGDLVHVHREKPLHLVESRVDREAFERMIARRSSTHVHRVPEPTQYADRHANVPGERRTQSDGQVDVSRERDMEQEKKRSVSEKNVSSTFPSSSSTSPTPDPTPIVAEGFTQSPGEYGPRSDEHV
ncbi:hypothetical protein QCA50_020388 [Cerrena zonata]|uniref:Uncharacterized protein n=1 Tax=Cerrena zonata TaxID=2478898 RepID=A0AAW0FJ30_9APHY